jgi:hypothetical protein
MIKKLILSIMFFVFMLPVFVFADLGPKPKMDFEFVYETEESLAIVSGQQLECEDQGCTVAEPLEDYGPQGFFCKTNLSCQSLAYEYPFVYQKLRIVFSDKVRESNVFKTDAYYARFKVRVTNSALIVEETIPPGGKVTHKDALAEFNKQRNKRHHELMVKERRRAAQDIPGHSMLFLIAFLVTLALELSVALIFVQFAKISKRILLFVFVANFISLPIVWFVFPFLRTYYLVIIFSELFAFIFEAYFIFLFNKKHISLKQSFQLSLIINLCSFFIGELIFRLL